MALIHNSFIQIANPEEAALCIENGMTVAMSGSASSGYPKIIPDQLFIRKRQEEEFQINLLTSSYVAPLDDLLGIANIIRTRMPQLESRILSKQANNGNTCFYEQQIGKLPRLLNSRVLGKIDVAVIEALSVTDNGWIIPTSSVGFVPHFINMADTVIVEINDMQPPWLEGLHDIYVPEFPPCRKPIPLVNVGQRIGEKYIKIDPKKIKYIVSSQIPDAIKPIKDCSNTTHKITEILFNFLELEVKRRGYKKLPPIQTGFGEIAYGIVNGLKNTNFQDIEFFCGAIFEPHLELLNMGKIRALSASSMQITPRTTEIAASYSDELRKYIVLRNADITNDAETTGRMGLIALNSGIEVDIYGNVNTSHIMGTNVVNGIGGGANFAQNAELSIVVLPSVAKNETISAVVPMVSHHDIIEHDVDIVITENGIADLRGKSEIGRAMCIIQNCASPLYKDILQKYLERAIEQNGGHHPHLMQEALSWHTRLKDKGTMII